MTARNLLFRNNARWSALAVLTVVAVPSLACNRSAPSPRSGAVLGTAESFTVLAGSTVTNTGPTTIAGSVGVSPGLAITGFPPGVVTGGTIHAGDAVTLQAQQDVSTAYGALAGQACDHDLTGQDLGGLTLTPGVYCFSSSAELTGALTLDGQGNADAVFVFQIGSTLTTASQASVLAINGAGRCNVFWQVGSSATLGTTTTFVGNILALTSVSLTTGAQVFGRALARNGAVTMDTNHLEMGTCAGAPGADGGTGGAGDAGAVVDGGAGSDGSSGGGGGGGGVVDAGHEGCVLCGDISVDIQTDRDNCGGCGNRCSWDSQCVAGACTCTATTCGTICVKLDQNPENCGACGHACAADEWCDKGSCSTVCAGTVCNHWCTNLMTNEGACGACGHHCGDAESCTNGVCVCAGTMCGSACLDLSSSVSNCGACGNACGVGQCCTDGQCAPL